MATDRINTALAQARECLHTGQPERALGIIKRALSASPSHPALLAIMVEALLRTGPADQLLFYAERCLKLHPDNPETVRAYCMAHASSHRHQEVLKAARAYLDRHGADERADSVRELYLYSCAITHSHDEAAAEIARIPGDLLNRPAIAHQVATQHMQNARSAQGIALFERLTERDPLFPPPLGDLCYASTLSATHGPMEVLEIHQRYGRAIEAMKAKTPPAPECHTLLPSAGRRVRIGFISPDLRDHSVAFFLEPILRHLPRDRFEIICFQLGGSDHVTQRLMRALATGWQPGQSDIPQPWIDLNGLDMEDIAAQIRAHRIDVIFELAGHTSGGALMAMARNPAPIRVSYCGYPATTGLSDVQYRIVDSNTDPAGFDSHSVETLVRLDPCFLCYQASPEIMGTPVGPLPAEKNGYVTFGSFNAIAKFNPVTAALWAGALRAVPNSRLVLKAHAMRSKSIAGEIVGEIARHGIDPERITTVTFLPRREDAMALYNTIDIGVDPFPYHGTTTTCEALCMGVPVLSLAGDRHAARVGRTLLSAVNLREWSVDSAEQFALTAQKMASDLPALAELRRTLRERTIGSVLCDQVGYCQRFGDAVAAMVDRHAAQQPGRA